LSAGPEVDEDRKSGSQEERIRGGKKPFFFPLFCSSSLPNFHQFEGDLS
jgi:hypothetical protein